MNCLYTYRKYFYLVYLHKLLVNIYIIVKCCLYIYDKYLYSCKYS